RDRRDADPRRAFASLVAGPTCVRGMPDDRQPGEEQPWHGASAALPLECGHDEPGIACPTRPQGTTQRPRAGGGPLMWECRLRIGDRMNARRRSLAASLVALTAGLAALASAGGFLHEVDDLWGPGHALRSNVAPPSRRYSSNPLGSIRPVRHWN